MLKDVADNGLHTMLEDVCLKMSTYTPSQVDMRIGHHLPVDGLVLCITSVETHEQNGQNDLMMFPMAAIT